MFIPTLITHRPDLFQVEHWANRDGVPFRAHVVDCHDVTTELWHESEALLVDVQDIDLMTQLYRDRDGFTILVGYGELDDRRMVREWAAGRSNGASRLDRFDSRAALLAILDGFRQGQGHHLMEVLSRG